MNLFFTVVMLRIQLVADDGHAAALSNTSSAVCAQTPAMQGCGQVDYATVRTKYYNAQYKLCPRNLRCGGNAATSAGDRQHTTFSRSTYGVVLDQVQPSRYAHRVLPAGTQVCVHDSYPRQPPLTLSAVPSTGNYNFPWFPLPLFCHFPLGKIFKHNDQAA